jgi:transposase
MPVIYRGATGHFETAKKLVQKRAYYLIHQEKIKSLKFGYTSRPEDRLRLYKSRGSRYNYMYVIYQTQSVDYMRQMEDYLIKTYPDYCDNSIGGGGGNIGLPPYFTYCVTHIPKKYL